MPKFDEERVRAMLPNLYKGGTPRSRRQMLLDLGVAVNGDNYRRVERLAKEAGHEVPERQGGGREPKYLLRLVACRQGA